MRLRLIILTIILGIIIGGAAFFISVNHRSTEGLENRNLNQVISISDDKNSEWKGGTEVSGNANSAQAFLLPISEANYLPIRDFSVSEPVIGARAAVLFDVNSGRFLYSKNMNERLPIASVTKLMTAVVILENMDLNRIYTVPAEDINVDGLGADLYKNEQLRGADLLKIMLIKSSNDAALTFATEARKLGIDLVAKMNEKAEFLNMPNTKFADPAGLDQNTFSTAADLVKLVRYAKKYGLISEILTTVSADVNSADGRWRHHLINTDQLLGRIAGIILGKTGYTDEAIGTMALDVSINGDKDDIISVILGSGNRFGETKTLIDWVKKAYIWK